MAQMASPLGRRNEWNFLHRFWELQLQSLIEDMAERLLVEQVIAGQPDAMKGLVDRCGPVVFRVLRRFRISQQDCEDCWHTVLLRLCKDDYARLRSWRGGSLCGYIAVMARRVAIDLLRSRTFVKDGRTTKREVPLEPDFDPASDDKSGGDTMGPRSEATIRQVASTCLTPRHFEIYERYCRGENAEQIGKALNMAPNHVYVEKHRMVRALRECLKNRGLWPLSAGARMTV
jgi:RNA polymerase sigma factor (sigma-70 family)